MGENRQKCKGRASGSVKLAWEQLFPLLQHRNRCTDRLEICTCCSHCDGLPEYVIRTVVTSLLPVQINFFYLKFLYFVEFLSSHRLRIKTAYAM